MPVEKLSVPWNSSEELFYVLVKGGKVTDNSKYEINSVWIRERHISKLTGRYISQMESILQERL